jgi:translation elongation factor EF-Ts
MKVGGKPHYLDAINQIHNKICEHMISNKLTESSFIDENFVMVLSDTVTEAIKTFKVNDKSGLYVWLLAEVILLVD